LETAERGHSKILSVNPKRPTEIRRATISTLYGFFFIKALTAKIKDASVPLMKHTLYDLVPMKKLRIKALLTIR
jgi:hypothetical protein